MSDFFAFFVTHFVPFFTIAVIWFLLVAIAWTSYYCWGATGQWPDVYEYNQRLGANYKYIIRFRFGQTKKDYDSNKTRIKVEIFTEKEKKLSVFTMGPKLLSKAISSGEHYVIRFFLHRRNPLKKIVRVYLNHDGNGALFVETIEIQGIDSEKANIVYVNEYIYSVPTNEVKMRQNFPAGSLETRSIEKIAQASKLLTFVEFLAFIWLTINLIPMFCLFLILCTTYEDLNFKNGTHIHFCNDFRDELFSSTSSAVMSSTIASIIFIVLILIYRFVIKASAVNGSEYCDKFTKIYVVIVATIGWLSGVFAAFDSLKSAKSATNESKFLIYWILSLTFGIIIFLMVWLPFLSIIAYCIGFYSETKAGKKSVDQKPDTSQSTGSLKNQKEAQKESETKHKTITGNLKVKSASQYSGAKDTKDKVQDKETPKDKDKDQKAKPAADQKTKAATKTDSQESIGEGYYQQLIKEQKKVKSISQY